MAKDIANTVVGFMQQKIADATLEAANFYAQLTLANSRIDELEKRLAGADKPDAGDALQGDTYA